MRWRNAVASIALLIIFATKSFAAERFACAEYFAATPAGQKKAEAGVKGTLIFDQYSKKVEFLNPKGTPAFSINYDEIHAMQYEKTNHPRYVPAEVISPAFLLPPSNNHYPTLEYNHPPVNPHSAI